MPLTSNIPPSQQLCNLKISTYWSWGSWGREVSVAHKINFIFAIVSSSHSDFSSQCFPMFFSKWPLFQMTTFLFQVLIFKCLFMDHICSIIMHIFFFVLLNLSSSLVSPSLISIREFSKKSLKLGLSSTYESMKRGKDGSWPILEISSSLWMLFFLISFTRSFSISFMEINASFCCIISGRDVA